MKDKASTGCYKAFLNHSEQPLFPHRTPPCHEGGMRLPRHGVVVASAPSRVSEKGTSWAHERGRVGFHLGKRKAKAAPCEQGNEAPSVYPSRGVHNARQRERFHPIRGP